MNKTRYTKQSHERHGMHCSDKKRLLKELKQERHAIRLSLYNLHRKEHLELENKLIELEKKAEGLHLQHHFRIRRSGFAHYSRNINYSKIFTLIFNLILWGILFRFGGVGTGVKIVILFFAMATTLGSILQMFFLLSIQKRILKPIDNLKYGVDEIAQGNYDVEIESVPWTEVGNLTDAFNEMAKKLAEGERLKAEYEENRKLLIANISHDLKTPMTSVQGYIEAIVDEPPMDSERLEKYLKIIASNTAFMNKLIDDLFLFSKLDMQKLELSMTDVEMKPFMKDLTEEFQLDLEEKGVSFEYLDMLPHGSIVRLDAKRFCQILRNLIDNAVKYGPAQNLILRTTLYSQDGEVCIDLRDNGPGIPEDKVKHIFDRFYRVDDERTKNLSSTGLGLAIAKELAEAHGGHIEVKSAEGSGTCFTVIIPAREDDKDEKNSDH